MKIVELSLSAWRKIIERLNLCKREIKKRDKLLEAYRKQVESYNQTAKDI